MQAGTTEQLKEPPQNEEKSTLCLPPSFRGLKRMEGTSQLKPTLPTSPMKRRPASPIKSRLGNSSSMMYLGYDSGFNSSTTSFASGYGWGMGTPTSAPRLARTKTSTVPFKMQSEKKAPLKIHQEEEKTEKNVTPIRIMCNRSPEGAIHIAEAVHTVSDRLDAPAEQDQFTPPTGMRRSSSSSMLLRQTPERIRRQEEVDLSPKRRLRRSGSIPRSLHLEDVVSTKPQSTITPVLKRKRTSSLTSLLSDMPVLKPQRFRPRNLSESRIDGDGAVSPRKTVAPLMASPLKKRTRQISEGGPPSPSKKRYLSATSIALKRSDQDAPTFSSRTSIKTTIFNPKAVSQHIAQNYGSGSKWPVETAKSTSPLLTNPEPPKLVTRSTSGDTYYSATEDDLTQRPSLEKITDAFLTPHSSESFDEKMVPLVKKQISIDEKILEDSYETEVLNSMKTIKKGQGNALARSLSLKLSPRVEASKPISSTEKSCSTPSLPTAPLVRQGSTSSLRFKVSPSTFLKPLVVTPVVVPAAPSAPPASEIPHESFTIELSEPSTSKALESVEIRPISMKSALKTPKSVFKVRDEHGSRRRQIKFNGLDVHYFDRCQGESTVPTEGDVSLDMHNTHHCHRHFSLASGKRPLLDLTLYEDDELSEGEEIYPDSDEDRTYDEYASAKTIPRINQRLRIKMLKKSGVKVEKNSSAMEAWRSTRTVCGCTCENGVCLPETCQCALDGINCQVDGGADPTHPCSCFIETCDNPEGRIAYNADEVQEFRRRTIDLYKASQKTGISGSPVVKKFVDSDDEDNNKKPQSWPLHKIKLEETPTKFPVTPVYTRRARSSLSDIRESGSEPSTSAVSSISLSERMKAMQHLDNEVCVEEEEREDEDVDKEETIVETDLTLQEVYSAPDPESMSADTDLLETAMSPVKTTLVV